MPEKKPGGLKLKLRKADTNRLKTQTGRIKTQSPSEDPAEAQTQAVPVPPPQAAAQPAPPQPPQPPPPPPAAPQAEQTAEIRDPMAMRDTSHGRLKRIQSPDETASAVSPAPVGEPGVKRETVRLKVVRDNKKGGPQILPDSPAPVPEDAAATVAPSAQTIKISLPGLKKVQKKQGEEAMKRATSTVRVQELPESASGTLKVSPPDAEGAGEYRETSTSTLKIGLGKPGVTAPPTQEASPSAPGPASSGTLKIKPGSRLSLQKGQPEQSKQVTAALKVVPGSDSEDSATQAPDAAVANKQVTATLKVRDGAPADEAASATVKISLPKEPPAPTQETTGDKPSLRLRKPQKTADTGDTVRVPLPAEVAKEDASKTVALSPASSGAAQESGATVAAEPQAAEAGEPTGEPEAAAAPVVKPRPASQGPGPLSFVIRFAACGALGALVYRLVMDFLSL